jgi:hypothetical protein
MNSLNKNILFAFTTKILFSAPSKLPMVTSKSELTWVVSKQLVVFVRPYFGKAKQKWCFSGDERENKL